MKWRLKSIHKESVNQKVGFLKDWVWWFMAVGGTDGKIVV
jgi:hypothetical protein